MKRETSKLPELIEEEKDGGIGWWECEEMVLPDAPGIMNPWATAILAAE